MRARKPSGDFSRVLCRFVLWFALLGLVVGQVLRAAEHWGWL